MDFQWHPSKLFWEGINHYKYFLEGGKMFMAQGGQYGHALQIILYPFTLVEWQIAKAFWVVINVLLSFLIPFLIYAFRDDIPVDIILSLPEYPDKIYLHVHYTYNHYV